MVLDQFLLEKMIKLQLLEGQIKDIKVIQVQRRKYAIHIDKLTKNKANGAPYQIPIHPSKVSIIKIKEGKDRMTRVEKVLAGINARKGKADKKIKTTN